ncbi:CocE/NonD family hydrolase, partial [Mesorhizobium sp. M0239]|uniref:CocE/NonD family hydrolase n=1 Tax=Mesorhizobium sp. M0239 TaxID=2956924 RepID=UPI00333E0F4A
PATHCKTATLEAPTVIGERELGDARLDCWHIYLDWFDGWLKEMPDRIESVPRVQYYVMGRNEWRSSSEWPPAGVELQRWFLRSGGNANTRLGDGALELNPPSEDEPADTFVYDPGRHANGCRISRDGQTKWRVSMVSGDTGWSRLAFGDTASSGDKTPLSGVDTTPFAQSALLNAATLLAIGSRYIKADLRG